MEFEIGNLFYIVITLVAVIVGLLGKKKKPTVQGTGESEGQAQPGFLENLEKTFNMGQPDPAVADLQDDEEDLQDEEWKEELNPATKSEPMSLMEEYELLLEERQGSQQMESNLLETDILATPFDVVDPGGEEGTDFYKVIQDFDAGTAIVYSAIINRLDY